jgi:hypothetical protein
MNVSHQRHTSRAVTTPQAGLVHIALGVGLVLGSFAAHAKLPAPTLTQEQKDKAAEAAAKTAWGSKVADFQLCRSMDRVAAHMQADLRKRGATPPAVEPPAPACVDPGAFVPPVAVPAPAAASAPK